MSHVFKRSEDGFGAVEGLLVIVLIVIIAGAGILVFKNRKTADSLPQSENAVTTASSQVVDAKKIGTTDGVEQDNSNETAGEDSINASHTNSDQQNVASANSAASNIGGAYNESTF